MKAEYDFSKGTRGKFYHPDLDLQIPVYLDEALVSKVASLAEMRGVALKTLLEEWLKHNLAVIESVTPRTRRRKTAS